MSIDFRKLQQIFIESIKSNESIILRPTDVTFIIGPNYESVGKTTLRILVFRQTFSHGYFDDNTNEDYLLNDCFSRLHDYDMDSPKSHIWGLKKKELEEDYEWQVDKLHEHLHNSNPSLKWNEINVSISDVAPCEIDSNGFRQYSISIFIKNQKIIEKELDLNNYNFKLSERIIDELSKSH
jgi:hypothetical protein